MFFLIRKIIPYFGYAVCFLLFCINVRAQSADQYVVTTGGGMGTISGNTIDFTIGEMVIATVGTNPIFTQGIQQPNATGIILPVRLLSFTAIAGGEKGLLNWITTTETNNSKFIVERSTDGVNFTPIGTVESKAINGNSNTNLPYNFTDILPQKGKNYYRLNQFDKDGKNYYSNTVLLHFTGNTPLQLSIYPNPVSSILNIHFNRINEAAVLNIYNMEGLKIMSKSANGLSLISMDVHSLPVGTYMLEYIAESGKVKERFVKVK